MSTSPWTRSHFEQRILERAHPTRARAVLAHIAAGEQRLAGYDSPEAYYEHLRARGMNRISATNAALALVDGPERPWAGA